MKDGTAKKLAQIDLDYQKRARAIQEAEKKLLELQEKEIDAQYKNDTSSERFLAGQQMIAQYKGNVNHLARPLVKAAELVKKAGKMPERVLPPFSAANMVFWMPRER